MRRAGGAFAASVLLGLPAAVLAHASIFGRAHLLGGWAHAVVLAVGAVAGLIVLGAIVPAAVLGARHGLPGAALSRKLNAFAPSAAAVIASTATWFALIELQERPHAIPLFSLIALCVAALAARVAFKATAHAAAGFACELYKRFSAHGTSPVVALVRGAVTLPTLFRSYRLYSRPPPA